MARMTSKKPRRGRRKLTHSDLYKIAQTHEIPGRSKMKRDELLVATRAVRSFKRRNLKKGYKRIIVLRNNVAHEVSVRPRKQTKRGLKQDQRTKAKTIIKDNDVNEFGWLGDTEQDILEYNYAHYNELSLDEQRMVDKILKEVDKIEKYGNYQYSGSMSISTEAKKIAKRDGITVIEAQHLINRLEGQNIDSQTIDFSSINFEDYENSAEAFLAYQRAEGEGALEFYY
jgi:hypothetical protein